MQYTDTFKLNFGIIFAGKRHQIITIKELTLGDLLEVDEQYQDADVVKKAAAIIAKSIVKFGDIPIDKIDCDLVLKLCESEFEIVQERRELLKKNSQNFCMID